MKTVVHKPVTYYLDGRLYEWVMSVGSFIISLMIVVWPEISRGPNFQFMSTYLSESVIIFVFLLNSIAKIGALLANGGSLAVGPRVRAACAGVYALIWAQFVMSLIKISVDQGYPAAGIPFWGMFTLAEIYVAYRATLDVRISE